MPHDLSPNAGLYKPSSISINIDSQKMFIDNINQLDALFGAIHDTIHGGVADLTALKAIDTTSTADTQFIVVKSLGLFRLDRASSATPNDVSIVQPTTGIGRWIRMARMDGMATDSEIGSRTVDQGIATATADTGTITQLLSWVAKAIKSVTGKADWKTAPAITLEATKSHVDASAPHTGHINHSLAQAANDFLISSGAGVFVRKTLAEAKTILGLGSAAYTSSTDYAVASKGVTNGDSHDHNGGDGAQIDHTNLANKGTNTHDQIDTHLAASAPHSGHINHALSTAANDFLVGSGTNSFIKKTLAEVKVILGLGSAAYTSSSDYAVAAKGVTNGDSHDHNGGDGAQIDHTNLANKGTNTHDQIDSHINASAPHSGHISHSLATAANDFLVASGAGAFVKKTLAEVKTLLGLGSAAYTNSGDYAVAAKGVTNGDSHDHNGGDGAQIDHANLANKGTNTHSQIDTHLAASAPHSGHISHSLATAVNDFLVASGAGTFVKKTLAEVKAILGLGSAAYTSSTDYLQASAYTANDILIKVKTVDGVGSGLDADTVDGVGITGSATAGLRKVTSSTLDPSGGSDGDLWIKYV